MSLHHSFAKSLAAISLVFTACGADRPAPVKRPVPGADFSEVGKAKMQPEAPLAASDGQRPISPDDQLFFGFDSDRLDQDGRTLLAGVAVWVKADPARKIVVQGHADTVGDSHYNFDLSVRRARATATQLRHLGVPQRQLVVVAVGESEAGLKPSEVNRRVVIFATAAKVVTR